MLEDRQGKATAVLEPFPVADDDPLAPAHRAVTQWIDDVLEGHRQRRFNDNVELKALPSGQTFLAATPAEAVAYVYAAVLQVYHWRRLREIENRTADARSRVDEFGISIGFRARERWRHAATPVTALMRRSLPLEKQHLLALLVWCNGDDYYAPHAPIVRALERYVSKTPLDAQLHGAVCEFADRLRNSSYDQLRKLATTVARLSDGRAATPDAREPELPEQPPVDKVPAPKPSMAGTPGVLAPLKSLLGMSPATVPGVVDRFVLRDDSPLRPEHELLARLRHEFLAPRLPASPRLSQVPSDNPLLAMGPNELSKVLLAAAEEHLVALSSPDAEAYPSPGWQARASAAALLVPLLELPVEFSRDDLFDFLLYLSASRAHVSMRLQEHVEKLLEQVERLAAETPLTEGERFVLTQLRASLVTEPMLDSPSNTIVQISRLVGDDAPIFLVPGEVWSDAVNDFAGTLTASQRRAFAKLLAHALTAASSKPSAKWLKTAATLAGGVGNDQVVELLQRWLPLVSAEKSQPKIATLSGNVHAMNEGNATCLRGLLWLIEILPARERLAREITSVALSSFKKVPGVGPRAAKVGNAAVYALSQIDSTDAVGQLALLKVRVKGASVQKELEKAFNAAAEALSLPRDQIEEIGVPSYGLEPGGTRKEALGDYRAELVVDGSDAKLLWYDSQDKPLKSVPVAVKRDQKEDLQDLQQSLKDIQAMLPAQRDRIDSMFLLQKSWPFDEWRQRYLDHPLVGTISRRLLWCVDGEPALFVDGVPTDRQGNQLIRGPTAEVTTWHPVGRPIEEITSWRQRLEELGVTQPFKQAHREVYLLTDAERNTNTYSNRFAAHVLRQHQFNALCAARGWKNSLRLMVDSAYRPPSKYLPRWGLRAEFWVEGIGDDYGVDTNETGVYLRLATDQVRFYRTDAAENAAQTGGGRYVTNAPGPGQDNVNEPVLLEQIPPLVFSEIMRDVDLFVGVSSVGNDPTWQDGGPEGRYREYWQSYSFGQLSGTASTRKEVLQRLIPRLKIAEQCSFDDRFLIVRGQKRTYKIHLGSGNILMEPNDQYLCIVPDAHARAKQPDLFLPFEGDGTLSIILSKALLLAEDHKISDPTIVRQIDHG